MLNSVNLLGRLAQDPELRYTTNGTPVASFDLAVQAPSKDKNTPPHYIPIVAWSHTAEFASRHLTKGRQVVVAGHITTRRWKDKYDQKRKSVEVTADNIYFTDSKPQEQHRMEQLPPEPSTEYCDVFTPDDSDDLPF